jgi:hypothetical protein
MCNIDGGTFPIMAALKFMAALKLPVRNSHLNRLPTWRRALAA